MTESLLLESWIENELETCRQVGLLWRLHRACCSVLLRFVLPSFFPGTFGPVYSLGSR